MKLSLCDSFAKEDGNTWSLEELIKLVDGRLLELREYLDYEYTTFLSLLPSSIHISEDANSMKIIHLITTNSALLLVYRTTNNLYSYQILFRDGSVYQPQELYHHAYIALNVGRDRIKLVTGHPE